AARSGRPSHPRRGRAVALYGRSAAGRVQRREPVQRLRVPIRGSDGRAAGAARPAPAARGADRLLESVRSALVRALAGVARVFAQAVRSGPCLFLQRFSSQHCAMTTVPLSLNAPLSRRLRAWAAERFPVANTVMVLVVYVSVLLAGRALAGPGRLWLGAGAAAGAGHARSSEGRWGGGSRAAGRLGARGRLGGGGGAVGACAGLELVDAE